MAKKLKQPEIDHLSFSSIKIFNQCPFQLYLKLTEKKRLSSEIQEAGTENHLNIAQILTEKTEAGLSTLRPRLISFYHNVIKKFEYVTELEFEQDFLITKIQGRIDLVGIFNQDCLIIDWKSNSGMQDEEQLLIYAAAMLEKKPNLENFFCYFYFLNGDYAEPHRYTAQEVKEFSNNIQSSIEKIMAETEWKATPGSHCSYCNHPDKCPEMKKFDIQKIETPKDLIQTLQRIYVAQAYIDSVKESAEKYMLDNSINEIPISATECYRFVYAKPSLRQGKITGAEKQKASLEFVEKVITSKLLTEEVK